MIGHLNLSEHFIFFQSAVVITITKLKILIDQRCCSLANAILFRYFAGYKFWFLIFYIKKKNGWL